MFYTYNVCPPLSPYANFLNEHFQYPTLQFLERREIHRSTMWNFVISARRWLDGRFGIHADEVDSGALEFR